VPGVSAGPIESFQDVHRAYLQTERAAGGPIDRFFTIGGYSIRLRFAGPALEPLITPALEHLASVPVPTPALTVCLWDDAATSISTSSPPWLHACVTQPEPWVFNDARFSAIAQPASCTINILDKATDTALYWIQDACLFPRPETGSPLLKILQWWMGSHGRQLIHAGAVGTTEGGVLLAGKSGSGKSTAALACLTSGMVYVGDDNCLLSNDLSPYVHSLYNTGKICIQDAERFPLLRPAFAAASHLGTEKAVYLIHEHFPDRVAAGFPIRAVLIPRITGRSQTSLTPASSIEALKALGPSTVLQLRAGGYPASVLQEFARLVSQVPCYYLELGANLSAIPGVILPLLSSD
jgi:hypothetical protein